MFFSVWSLFRWSIDLVVTLGMWKQKTQINETCFQVQVCILYRYINSSTWISSSSVSEFSAAPFSAEVFDISAHWNMNLHEPSIFVCRSYSIHWIYLPPSNSGQTKVYEGCLFVTKHIIILVVTVSRGVSEPNQSIRLSNIIQKQLLRTTLKVNSNSSPQRNWVWKASFCRQVSEDPAWINRQHLTWSTKFHHCGSFSKINKFMLKSRIYLQATFTQILRLVW